MVSSTADHCLAHEFLSSAILEFFKSLNSPLRAQYTFQQNKGTEKCMELYLWVLLKLPMSLYGVISKCSRVSAEFPSGLCWNGRCWRAWCKSQFRNTLASYPVTISRIIKLTWNATWASIAGKPFLQMYESLFIPCSPVIRIVVDLGSGREDHEGGKPPRVPTRLSIIAGRCTRITLSRGGSQIDRERQKLNHVT